jgi:hypothetical protein
MPGLLPRSLDLLRVAMADAQIWTSAPLPVPRHPQAPYAQADLEFHDVLHDGPSYRALVYFNHPDADAQSGHEGPGFAGSFSLFAHGNCWGDLGHCDVPSGPLHPFDRRSPHPLTPIAITLDVTEALQAVTEPELRVTVVCLPVIGADQEHPLRFAKLVLVTYD